jgi:protein-S-isoprenylcysteine O-methyltransferase Ste14
MTQDAPPRRDRWLHRGRLRDVVIVMAVVSTFFFSPGMAAQCVAVGLLVVGGGLHLLVKGQLIRNRVLCTQGAYAVVRHPYYLANYLIDTGFCLASGNVYLVLAYPFLFFWAYGPTLRSEESLLASLHGAEFDAYRASVPQVFPDATLLAGLRALGRNYSWQRVSAYEVKRLFRCAFVGALIVLLGRIGPDGWREILAGGNPLDRRGVVLLALCAVLLLPAVLIRFGRGESDVIP